MSESPKHERTDVHILQVRKIGNSIGFILPKETVARLSLKEGDRLFVMDQPGGGFVLTPRDPDFERAMAVARRGMKRYHNALAELAK